MKEHSCDYRVYTRKIYIVRGKLKNFKGDNNTSETYIGLTETDLKTGIEHCFTVSLFRCFVGENRLQIK